MPENPSPCPPGFVLAPTGNCVPDPRLAGPGTRLGEYLLEDPPPSDSAPEPPSQ